MKYKISLLFFAMTGAAWQAAGAAEFIPFGPYAGDTGYQEIKLADQSWYVAVFGNRKTELAWVESGWKARAAQLCAGVQANYFVEMRYVGERIFIDEKSAAREGGEVSRLMRMAGTAYIPIYVPSGPREVSDYVVPGKQAPIRCLLNPALLNDRARAVSVQEMLSQARKDRFIAQ